jgi:phage terminase small subunit
LLAGSFSPALAQEAEKIRAKGRVLDEQTNEPMAFVNIGLVGTTMGVASNTEGYFELAVPPRYANHATRFSAIGYASREMQFHELQGNEEVVVYLKPVAYALADVKVVGTVDATRRLLEKVVNNIPKNYISRPYNYEGYFERVVSVNGKETEKKEAIVLLHDKRGYERVDVARAFTDLNYTFTQVRRGKPFASAADGMIYFDDVVTADVVRHARNALDTKNSREYRFRDKGKTFYDGDTVQVIAYECLRPSLSTTGDYAPLTCSGEIYIKLKDLAVIKYVATITSSHFNVMGRNLAPVNEPRQEKCTTTMITNYKKVSSYYFMSGASIDYSYETGGNQVKGKVQYHTTGVRLDDPLPVAGRLYYEQMDADYSFWDRHTLSLDEVK